MHRHNIQDPNNVSKIISKININNKTHKRINYYKKAEQKYVEKQSHINAALVKLQNNQDAVRRVHDRLKSKKSKEVINVDEQPNIIIESEPPKDSNISEELLTTNDTPTSKIIETHVEKLRCLPENEFIHYLLSIVPSIPSSVDIVTLYASRICCA